MLTITPIAAEALDSIVAAAPVGERAGLRITRAAGASGEEAFSLALAEQPSPDDQIVEGQGEHVPVFIEADAAETLDDKVLDAQIDGGQIGFVIAEPA